MNFKKTAIAFILLFAYSIGFAHDLVPHYHIEDNHFGSNHAEGHQHVSPENHDANTIAHAEHLDGNLYDYLECVFNEVQHSDYDTQVITLQNSVNSIDKFEKISPIQIVTETAEILTPYQKSDKIHPKPIRNSSDQSAQSRSRRGPPQFS